MLRAVRRLLRQSLDYAGLFPPAGLSLPVAVEAYSDYLGHPQAEILSSFVLPVQALPEAGRLLPEDCDWAFSGLLKGTEIREASRKIAEFRRRYPQARVEIIEADIPTDVPLEEHISELSDTFRQTFVFVEIDWRGLYERQMDAVLATWDGFGVKLRTGGLTPDAIPPPGVVANWIRATAARRLPMKATAGLHQPFPHFDSDVGAGVHGFVNVLFAAMAALHHQPPPAQLEAILRAGRDVFVFEETSVVCRGERYSLEQVDALRANFFRSFGSCSFLEPVEHLERAGLIG